MAKTWSYSGQSFTGAQSYAYLGGLSYSYAAGYSYSHSGSTSYSHSGPNSYSYAGPPVGPMLSAGISNARDELVNGARTAPLGGTGDVGASANWSSPTGANVGKLLPTMNEAALMRRWTPGIRTTLVEFELVSRLRFDCPVQQTGNAILYDLTFTPTSGSPTAVIATPIVTISRPTRALFEAQLAVVESRASLRDTRGPEILTQMDPPMGYFASIANLHSQRTPKTLELLQLAQHFAYIAVMRFKHALATPRPIEYTSEIQPIIETPAHATFPSGHATESYMAVGVLAALVPGFTPGGNPHKHLSRLAHRIADNRVVAGLHFPIDNLAGRLLGETLAEYFVAMATGAAALNANWTPRTFNGAALTVSAHGTIEPQPDMDIVIQPGCAPGAPVPVATPIPELAELWQHAQAEWV